MAVEYEAVTSGLGSKETPIWSPRFRWSLLFGSGYFLANMPVSILALGTLLFLPFNSVLYVRRSARRVRNKLATDLEPVPEAFVEFPSQFLNKINVHIASAMWHKMAAHTPRTWSQLPGLSRPEHEQSGSAGFGSRSWFTCVSTGSRCVFKTKSPPPEGWWKCAACVGSSEDTGQSSSTSG